MLEQLRQGGSVREKAMRELYLHEYDAAVTYLRKLGCDGETACDLFQDAVIQLLLAVEEDKFQGKSSIRTYLYAIGKNLWYTRLRRQGVEQKYQDRLAQAPEPAHSPTPEALMLEKSQSQQIQALLSLLGEACQQVLSLWSLRYDMREIAAKLGYANDQIARNKKSKCLSRLKKIVAEHPSARNMVRELVDLESSPES